MKYTCQKKKCTRFLVAIAYVWESVRGLAWKLKQITNASSDSLPFVMISIHLRDPQHSKALVEKEPVGTYRRIIPHLIFLTLVCFTWFCCYLLLARLMFSFWVCRPDTRGGVTGQNPVMRLLVQLAVGLFSWIWQLQPSPHQKLWKIQCCLHLTQGGSIKTNSLVTPADEEKCPGASSHTTSLVYGKIPDGNCPKTWFKLHSLKT